jgi:hypothetical protein
MEKECKDNIQNYKDGTENTEVFRPKNAPYTDINKVCAGKINGF